jgi:hypothetical protein
MTPENKLNKYLISLTGILNIHPDDLAGKYIKSFILDIYREGYKEGVEVAMETFSKQTDLVTYLDKEVEK